MTSDMLERVLRAFNRRRPFRSYLIEFGSGDRVLVRHPEAVTRHGELFLYRGPDRGQRLFGGMGVFQVLDAMPPPATGT